MVELGAGESGFDDQDEESEMDRTRKDPLSGGTETDTSTPDEQDTADETQPTDESGGFDESQLKEQQPARTSDGDGGDSGGAARGRAGPD